MTYTVRVAGVATDEDTVVQRVPLRDALADVVGRVPIDGLPFDAVRAENLVGHILDFGL